MPTNNLSPKSKNKLGIASPIPPKMSARFGSAVLPYLQSVQGLFPPTNPYGQATSNFLLGQAPQAAQQMAEGYPNVLFNTRNPHEIAAGVAQPGGSRVSIGSFIGRMPDRSLALWA